MKKNLINKEHIEGLIYDHSLTMKKVENKESQNFGKIFITGSIDVMTDNNFNVIPVHFTYVTAETARGKKNYTYDALAKVISEGKTVLANGPEEAFKIKIDTALGLNDFYADHCKIYQKRPIYWLFDSGKKNGFKALIYMHRYQPDTIARIRTDYVHEQQARYRTAIADLEQRIANASTGERVKLNKKLTALQAQDTEIRTYEEKIHHLADQMISIDPDDGVEKNYAIFRMFWQK